MGALGGLARLARSVPPLDDTGLRAALTGGTLSDFERVYRRRHLHYSGFTNNTLLTLALGNTNVKGRVAIAHRLLDDGADPRVGLPLHVLIGAARHDFVPEGLLLARLLGAGADVNRVSRRDGTALELAASRFRYSDATLAPFYDALLDRTELRLGGPGHGGRPVLVNIRKWERKRGDLLARLEARPLRIAV